MNHNSPKNLDIKRRFIKQEVYLEMTDEINGLLDLDDVVHDDMPNIRNAKNLPPKKTLNKIRWYAVSEYLIGELELLGEITLKWGNINLWGRTNNHINMARDPSITRICEDMQILEGQEYENQTGI